MPREYWRSAPAGIFFLAAWLARVMLQEMVRGVSAMAPFGQYPRVLPVVC
ncbi:MAG: hypothetical protein H7268_06210 [Sandarakinorhabdus sp.]|nr:hypothetical protein [Sandarakinorhabdus sp.]